MLECGQALKIKYNLSNKLKLIFVSIFRKLVKTSCPVVVVVEKTKKIKKDLTR